MTADDVSRGVVSVTDTHNTHTHPNTEDAGITSREGGHWLTFEYDADVDRHLVTGCHCGFEADIDQDCGWGDSVVEHIAEVARAEALAPLRALADTMWEQGDVATRRKSYTEGVAFRRAAIVLRAALPEESHE